MKSYLVALDTSPVATDVLTAAQDLAALTQARLLLVRAVGLPTELPPEGHGLSPANVVELLVNTARKNLTAKAEELHPELQAEAIVEIGPAGRVICQIAHSHDVNLIIIGAHGHRFLDRVLGSTTQYLVPEEPRLGQVDVGLPAPLHGGLGLLEQPRRLGRAVLV